jgi:hypothetical protein
MSNDAILIYKCPLCSSAHLYALQVSRSYWMGVNHAHVRPLQLTRLFTCPVTDSEFQISVTLVQPHGVDYTEVVTQGYIDIHVNLEDIFKLLHKQSNNGNEGDVLSPEPRNDKESLKVPAEGVVYKNLRILGSYGA